MTEKKRIPVKYFYYGIIGCIVFISAFFFMIWQSESNKREKLTEKGITVNGWVVELLESKVGKKSRSHYYMKVAFFADTT